MEFRGRTRELGTLRSAMDRFEPVLARVWGLPGAGVSTLVRRACGDLPTLHVTCPPLPDPDQRALLARRLEEEDGGELPWVGASGPPSWQELLDHLTARAARGGRPMVLVLDDAHRLREARARISGPLEALRTGRDEAAPPLHVVLAGRGTGLPAPENPPARSVVDLPLGPLPFRSAAPFLPGGDAYERLLSYGVFGGLPGTLRHLDLGVGLSANLRRTVLEATGPLADAGLSVLERTLQSPARYAAILTTLSGGDADWGAVHRGVRGLTASGQLAPYLKRLEEMGMVETRRSLDASPHGRSRRYRITDPFLAFWFRFVLPHRERILGGSAAELWSDAIRPELDEHLDTVFPEVCRQFMALDAMELLGANGREVGSLWGSGYDIEVAGTLSNGSPFYGRAPWSERARGQTLADLDGQIRETRYGFGRERRFRIVFFPREPSRDVTRAVARREDALLIGPEVLAGDA